SGVLRAPAATLAVLGPGGHRVRHGADDDAHVLLLVRLDGGLLAAAVGLAPGEGELGADLDVGVDGAQRQAAALVGAVPGEHRQADHLAGRVLDLVEVRGAVVGVGQVEELVARAHDVEQRGHDLAYVDSITRTVDLLALDAV